MMTLIRVHWEYIREPSKVLAEYIPKWPLGLGVVVWVTMSLANLTDANGMRMQRDMLAFFFDTTSKFVPYLFHLFWLVIGIAVIWWINPLIVRWVGGIERDKFDPNPYRRLIFFGPLASVVIAVCGILPLKVFTLVIGMSGPIGASMTILLTVIVLLQRVLGIWGLVALIMWMVLYWKGLGRYYGLTGLQTFLVMFGIPLAVTIPVLVFLFPRILEFLINYGPVGGGF